MFFSIITTAFNAELTLAAVFDSLRKQTFTDFEWIVVDDGSTDGTSLLLERLRSDSPFSIKLLRTENNHKKTALQYGLALATGFMTLNADADDTFPENALQLMYDCWMSIPNPEDYNGIVGLCYDENLQLIGDKFPQSPLDCDLIEMRLLYGIQGEKWGCLRTSRLKEVYPDYSDISGHVPEGIYQRKLSNKKVRCMNEVLRIYHMNVVGSMTNSGFNSANALGIVLDNLDWLENYSSYFRHSPLHFIKRAASYNKYLKYVPKERFGAIAPKTFFSRILILVTKLARFS